jgi:hypothetical protein
VTPWAVMTVILPNLVLIGFGLMVIAAAVAWGITRTARQRGVPPPPALGPPPAPPPPPPA